jgi:hypothetical protein
MTWPLISAGLTFTAGAFDADAVIALAISITSRRLTASSLQLEDYGDAQFGGMVRQFRLPVSFVLQDSDLTHRAGRDFCE